MTQSSHTMGDPGELAALYVAGAMETALAQHFERHMDECSICRAEVTRLDAVAAKLFNAVTPSRPAPHIRERLLKQVSQDAQTEAACAGGGPGSGDPPAARVSPHDPGANPQIWRDWGGDRSAALVTRHAGDGAWEQTGIPGITLRRLFVDRARNQISMLVRMAPGTAYPRHVHDGPEECYVVSGDLHVGDTVLRAGDYQRAEPESLHGVQWTEHGCELFLISSLTDELV